MTKESPQTRKESSKQTRKKLYFYALRTHWLCQITGNGYHDGYIVAQNYKNAYRLAKEHQAIGSSTFPDDALGVARVPDALYPYLKEGDFVEGLESLLGLLDKKGKGN